MRCGAKRPDSGRSCRALRGGAVDGCGQAPALGDKRLHFADVFYRGVVDVIANQHLEPGHRIGSISELADGFNASRAVVREGLRLLERDGVVRVKPGPGGGVFVTSPSVEGLTHSLDVYSSLHQIPADDVAEARLEIEVVMAGLATTRAQDREVAHLQALNRRWKSRAHEGGTKELAVINVAFHKAICRAAHNQVFMAIMDALEHLVYEAALQPEYPDDLSGEVLEYFTTSHDEILTAIEARDGDGAMKAMREHLQVFRPNAWKMPVPQEAGGAEQMISENEQGRRELGNC